MWRLIWVFMAAIIAGLCNLASASECETEDDLSPGTCELADLSKTELKKICQRVGFEKAMDKIRDGREVLLPSHDDYVSEAGQCLALEEIRVMEAKRWNRMVKTLFYEQYQAFDRETSSEAHFFLVHCLQLFAMEFASKQRGDPVEENEVPTMLKYEHYIDDAEKLADFKTKFFDKMDMDHYDAFANAVFSSVSNDKLTFGAVNEYHMFRLLVGLDPTALDRLVAGDVPDITPTMSTPMDNSLISLVGLMVFFGAVAFIVNNLLKEPERQAERPRSPRKESKKKKRK